MVRRSGTGSGNVSVGRGRWSGREGGGKALCACGACLGYVWCDMRSGYVILWYLKIFS